MFQDKDEEKKHCFGREEEPVADILCAAQMKDLLGEKSNTRMDCHLKDVRTQQRKLFDLMEDSLEEVQPISERNFTVSSSRKLLEDIKQNVAEMEKKLSKTVRRSNSDLRKSFRLRKINFMKIYFQTRELQVIISSAKFVRWVMLTNFSCCYMANPVPANRSSLNEFVTILIFG